MLVAADLIDNQVCKHTATIIIIPVPPNAESLNGSPIAFPTKYGILARIAKNGAPMKLTRIKIREMYFSVSSPDLTPRMNLPDFLKFSACRSGLI